MTATCETAPHIRRGRLVPPHVNGPLDVAATLAEIEQREFVSLPELGAKIGLGQQARKYAIREGLIEGQQMGGQGNPYQVTRDEAVTLLFAAVVAFAAGVAIATILRGLKGAGVTGVAAAAALEAMPT